MSGPVIVTGDDVSLAVTLKKNGATFSIDAGATVEASIITPDRGTILVAATAQASATPGADWANSLVVVQFSSALTNYAYTGTVVIEIQVDDSGKTTFFATANSVEGTI